MNENMAPKTTQESVASVVLTELEGTAERAEKTAAVVAEKTNSVTRDVSGEVEKVRSEKAQPKNFPPLFGRIRELTESINNSLDRIGDIMRRCEL